jgi:hypothetical protein
VLVLGDVIGGVRISGSGSDGCEGLLDVDSTSREGISRGDRLWVGLGLDSLRRRKSGFGKWEVWNGESRGRGWAVDGRDAQSERLEAVGLGLRGMWKPDVRSVAS